MAYDVYDVIVVPFPFTDKQSNKRRPALVVSQQRTFNKPAGHSVLAMITSQKNTPWPLDTKIENMQAAGLTALSMIRMKLFTLDNRLILKKIGSLSTADQDCFRVNFIMLLMKQG